MLQIERKLRIKILIAHLIIQANAWEKFEGVDRKMKEKLLISCVVSAQNGSRENQACHEIIYSLFNQAADSLSETT